MWIHRAPDYDAQTFHEFAYIFWAWLIQSHTNLYAFELENGNLMSLLCDLYLFSVLVKFLTRWILTVFLQILVSHNTDCSVASFQSIFKIGHPLPGTIDMFSSFGQLYMGVWILFLCFRFVRVPPGLRPLWAILGHPGAILGPSWAILGSSWSRLGFRKRKRDFRHLPGASPLSTVGGWAHAWLTSGECRYRV